MKRNYKSIYRKWKIRNRIIKNTKQQITRKITNSIIEKQKTTNNIIEKEILQIKLSRMENYKQNYRKQKTTDYLENYK